MKQPLVLHLQKIFNILVLMAAFTSSFSVRSASFDCNKAKSVNEKLICSDSELSQLDDQLLSKYKEAISRSEKKAEIIQTYRLAWKQRERECSTKQCLKDWLQGRIKSLDETKTTSSQQSHSGSLEGLSQGSFSAIVIAQKAIDKKNTIDANKETESNRLKEVGESRLSDIFEDFYKSAKSSGVKMEKIAPNSKPSRDGLMSTTIEALSNNGEFAIARTCALSIDCRRFPIFNIKNYGESTLTIYYDGEYKNGQCGDGTINIYCNCRLSAFSSNYTLPCTEFLASTGITYQTKQKIRSWLERSLTEEISQRRQ